ncbi:glycosyl hydrolase [Sporanaerobium hydrogeniformans]|uniref:Glycosyl hydrolase n=1 Tax=Sporanaerobium hydrogeniformans TaxID=3072179 RepID=A0AC61DHY4_9FIRM|nr:glycosyl hydrolase family 18 protein [Sporanaerobium hydrogeniformans]PHV72236.1 glycosyl hydrolase [Sporanaerobium hydrogeniformans]
MKKRMFMVGVGIICLFLVGCYGWMKWEKIEFAAWIVDWDSERGMEEYKKAKDIFVSSALFGGYFKEDGSLYFPEAVEKMKEELKALKKPMYLTIVNDVFYDSGKDIQQKDGNFIKALLKDPKKRKDHIEELVSAVQKGPFVGLELDYERLDEEAWENYSVFIKELGQILESKNKKLRIVLEPKSPIEKVDLPLAYDYVMMAYNLYGYHSGPGPKADKELIKALCNKMKANVSNRQLAFSLGGFDWVEGEKPQALTYSEAEALRIKKRVKATRDGASGAIWFRYKDEKGHAHEVWYADKITLESWVRQAYKEGISRFVIWRLGGNLLSEMSGL